MCSRWGIGPVRPSPHRGRPDPLGTKTDRGDRPSLTFTTPLSVLFTTVSSPSTVLRPRAFPPSGTKPPSGTLTEDALPRRYRSRVPGSGRWWGSGEFPDSGVDPSSPVALFDPSFVRPVPTSSVVSESPQSTSRIPTNQVPPGWSGRKGVVMRP